MAGYSGMSRSQSFWHAQCNDPVMQAESVRAKNALDNEERPLCDGDLCECPACYICRFETMCTKKRVPHRTFLEPRHRMVQMQQQGSMLTIEQHRARRANTK